MIEGFFDIRSFHSDCLPLFISPWQQILFLFAFLIFLYICCLFFTDFSFMFFLQHSLYLRFLTLFIPGIREVLDFLGKLYFFFFF